MASRGDNVTLVEKLEKMKIKEMTELTKLPDNTAPDHLGVFDF